MAAKSSGIRLSDFDAAIAKGMLERGDRQHDIAAWFGVNGGRIAEISNGSTFVWVEAIHDDLPPRAPYLEGAGYKSQEAMLRGVREHLTDLIKKIDSLL